MKQAKLTVCAVVALLFSGAAPAAPRVDGVSAKPNPATLAAPEVSLTVTIERPTPLDIQRCDVAVDPGDGSKPLTLTYDIGERRTKTVKHTYKKAGTYTVKAAGTGNRACQGTREVAVTVSGAAAAAKSPAAAPKCPDGWSLVPESLKKDSFSCRR